MYHTVLFVVHTYTRYSYLLALTANEANRANNANNANYIDLSMNSLGLGFPIAITNNLNVMLSLLEKNIVL